MKMKTIYTALVALALFVPSAKVVTAADEDIKQALVAANLHAYSTVCGSLGPKAQRVFDKVKPLLDVNDKEVKTAIYVIALKMDYMGKSAWCADFQDIMQE